MNPDRWQRFPVVSLDAQAQARRDAVELHHTVACTAQCYGIAPERMARALKLLARQWAEAATRTRT